jgi:hypothetical protein
MMYQRVHTNVMVLDPSYSALGHLFKATLLSDLDAYAGEEMETYLNKT